MLSPGSVAAQESCREQFVCFERGEAPLLTPEDFEAFLRLHHEKLGLSGDETFSCRQRGFLSLTTRRPEFADHGFVCEQTEVQGFATAGLYLQLDIWDRDDGVRRVRGVLVSEDALIASPAIDAGEAIGRGRRYLRAHYPDVDPEAVSVAAVRGPLIQGGTAAGSVGAINPVWNVTYAFPWDGGVYRTSDESTTMLSVDAVSNEIVRETGSLLRGSAVSELSGTSQDWRKR